jgi:hypothetical protein
VAAVIADAVIADAVIADARPREENLAELARMLVARRGTPVTVTEVRDPADVRRVARPEVDPRL